MNVHLNKEAEKRVHEIAERNGGRITPDHIIADAQKKKSPLHGLFEWDTEKAARSYWLETARSIIRQVKIKVTVETRDVNVVAYVRDPGKKGTKQQGYIALQQAAASEPDRLGVMAYELGRAAASLERVLAIADAVGMRAEAEGALEQVIGMRETINIKRGRKAIAA